MLSRYFLKVIVVALIIANLSLWGCTAAGDAVPTQESQSPVVVDETPLPEPTSVSQTTLESTQEEPAEELLPPEPQNIEFTAEDGTVLQGTYYPAAINPAPLVVLFHQAGFNQTMWQAIAPWLQNRGLANTAFRFDSGGVLARPYYQSFNDSSWFPQVPSDLQVAVFTFTFRCWESGSCGNYDREGWQKDALAAIKTAAGLPGVDPQRILTMGASIGGDGGVDACYLYNQEMGSGCIGAIANSPGSYLELDYRDTAEKLLGQGVPVLCAASQGDTLSNDSCSSVKENSLYQTRIYDGSAHGIYMVDPSLQPSLLELWLQFFIDTLNSQGI